MTRKFGRRGTPIWSPRRPAAPPAPPPPPRTGPTMTVVNDRGVPFTVRLVRRGDRYGLDDVLTHDEAEPLVEFYDARHTRVQSPHWNDEGQFIARYYLGTLRGHDPGVGLDLHGGEPDWRITDDNMGEVLAWLDRVAAPGGKGRKRRARGGLRPLRQRQRVARCADCGIKIFGEPYRDPDGKFKCVSHYYLEDHDESAGGKRRRAPDLADAVSKLVRGRR